MGADLIDRKLNRRFQLLDTNGNGYVEEDDYLGIVKKLTSAFGVDPESAKGKILRTNYLKLWRGLKLKVDTDGDGRISLAEFTNAVREGVLDRDGGFERAIQPATQSVLDLMDSDEDGVVTVAEGIVGLIALGLTPEQAATATRQLDTDGDGTLSLKEILVADKNFYTSNDPDAVGNGFFGPY